MRARSQKMAALYIQRRKLVASLLEERPWCEIRWNEGCEGRSVDVDEILSRAQGGSILDRDNLQTCCRHCHSQKHYQPAEAVARGFTVQRRSVSPNLAEQGVTDQALLGEQDGAA